MKASDQFHAPAALPPGGKNLLGKRTGGPRTVLEAVGKRRRESKLMFEHRNVRISKLSVSEYF
jgi:hypothetical protein